MSERGRTLAALAEAQIDELTNLIATREDSFLRLPCPGREKLGDGSVAASAMHVAGNYRRIAMFAVEAASVRTGDAGHSNGRSAPSPPPRATRGRPSHDALPNDRIDRRGILESLRVASTAVAQIAELSDPQLNCVPAADGMRFCDGRRSLDQILTAMLKHQEHQVRALGAAAA
jgi:hypothetical protein